MKTSLALARFLDLNIAASDSSVVSDWNDLDHVTDMLHDSQVVWQGRRTGLTGGCETVTAILKRYMERFNPVQNHGGLHEFSTVNAFESQTEFRSTMRGFGRSLGLAFRHRCPLSPTLFLIHHLMGAIHSLPPADFPIYTPFLLKRETRSEATIHQALEQRVFEPVFFIRLGLKDVLGPVGPQIFLKPEWFGYSFSIP